MLIFIQALIPGFITLQISTTNLINIKRRDFEWASRLVIIFCTKRQESAIRHSFEPQETVLRNLHLITFNELLKSIRDKGLLIKGGVEVTKE